MPPVAAAATQAQIEELINFMEINHELARGLLRGADGRIRSKRLWAEISNCLNAMGSCTKTIEQWQRVWADKKHLTKKAAAAARRSASATGGGPSDAPTLSQVELRILSIMGDGFGGPQTEARVPAFLLSEREPPYPAPAVSQSAAGSPLNEPAELEINMPRTPANENQQQTSRNSRPTRQRTGPYSMRSRLIHLEEQNNEELRGIKVALRELCSLVREYLDKNQSTELPSSPGEII